jgi:hypothetical protein
VGGKAIVTRSRAPVPEPDQSEEPSSLEAKQPVRRGARSRPAMTRRRGLLMVRDLPVVPIRGISSEY